MPDPEEPAGGESARERTALSWNRSGIALVACLAVLLRHLWPVRGSAQDIVLGLIAAAAIAWTIALLALVGSDAGRDEHLLLRPRVLRMLTAGTLTLAAAACVLTFVG